jgi:hypothetical protein
MKPEGNGNAPKREITTTMRKEKDGIMSGFGCGERERERGKRKT